MLLRLHTGEGPHDVLDKSVLSCWYEYPDEGSSRRTSGAQTLNPQTCKALGWLVIMPMVPHDYTLMQTQNNFRNMKVPYSILPRTFSSYCSQALSTI